MSRENAEERREAAARRLRLALEMFGLGESMMRQNLRRAHPEATDAEIEARLTAWLQTRPGAEDGDCPGKRIPVPQ
jgi:hypothetical protein